MLVVCLDKLSLQRKESESEGNGAAVVSLFFWYLFRGLAVLIYIESVTC